jgi:hypothetical protein
MKIKTILFFILTGLFFGCHRRIDQTKWRNENISGYSFKIPQGYSMTYMSDSIRMEITNNEIKIYFTPGYFNVDGIESGENVRSQSQLGSVKKVIYDMVENDLTTAGVALWDTSKVTHLLGDNKYKGCHLNVSHLTTIQTDTVMMIFNSLTAIKKY